MQPRKTHRHYILIARSPYKRTEYDKTSIHHYIYTSFWGLESKIKKPWRCSFFSSQLSSVADWTGISKCAQVSLLFQRIKAKHISQTRFASPVNSCNKQKPRRMISHCAYASGCSPKTAAVVRNRRNNLDSKVDLRITVLLKNSFLTVIKLSFDSVCKRTKSQATTTKNTNHHKFDFSAPVWPVTEINSLSYSVYTATTVQWV